MSWNYRVFKYKEGGIGLHEVYYNDKGQIQGFTQEPVISGDHIKDLLSYLSLMKKDIKKYSEILDYDNTPTLGWKEESI